MVCIAIPFIMYKLIVNGVNDSGERLIEMCSVCGMAIHILIREGFISTCGGGTVEEEMNCLDKSMPGKDEW